MSTSDVCLRGRDRQYGAQSSRRGTARLLYRCARSNDHRNKSSIASDNRKDNAPLKIEDWNKTFSSTKIDTFVENIKKYVGLPPLNLIQCYAAQFQARKARDGSRYRLPNRSGNLGTGMAALESRIAPSLLPANIP
jgi:hypothetical protein